MTIELGGFTTDDGKSNESKLEKKQPKLPARQILYDLVVKNIGEIFRDQTGDTYIVCNINGKKEALELDSENFRAFCRGVYAEDYERIQTIANGLEIIQSEIDVLKKEGAEYSHLVSEKKILVEVFKKEHQHEKVISDGELDNAREQVRALWNEKRDSRYLGKRVLWDKANSLAYFNLGNKDADIVRIWADSKGKGTMLVNNSELVLFRRLPNENEQVVPVFSADLTRRYLQEQLNGFRFKNGKHGLITEVYIISLFLDGIPHPIFLPNGPERSGKSTLQAKIKSYVDPRETHNMMSCEERAASNLSKIEIDPRKQWDRGLEFEGNWVTFGDNLSYIPQSMMDELCSLVQPGFRLTKKKNYTDKEQSVISILRPVGFNSITNFMAARPDANVRTFAPELLGREEFIDTEELWEQFYSTKPVVLGYIFGVISKFLHLYPLVRSEIVPLAKDGLTSFEKVGEVISRCLGNEPGDFQKAWAEYYAERLDNSIQQNTLAQLTIIYARQTGKKEFSVQPTDAYKQIKTIGMNNGYDLKVDHTFPSHQNHLTRALKRIQSILKKEGIEIETNEKENEQRVIRFRNLNFEGQEKDKQ